MQKSNPREVALLVLGRVEKDGAYSNIALNQELKKHKMPLVDSGLATELVYGTLRQQGTIDYIIDQFTKKPLAKLPMWILLILRLGVYQLYYMDKIPVSAAINEAVELAKKYGHQGTVGLVNATLRTIDRERDKITFPDKEKDLANYISVCYSHPRWLVERWMDKISPMATIAICEYDNQPAPFSVRVNTLKISVPECIELFKKNNIEVTCGEAAPDALYLPKGSALQKQEIFSKGLVYPQHESAMLAAHALAPVPGSKVMDVCAAPGGKSTHLAQLMNNQGEIRAFDMFPHKIQLIEQNCKRLGVNIVKSQVSDSSRPNKALENWADYALIDAPCSGLGVLQKRADSRWQKSPAVIMEMAAMGSRILENTAKCVKPGGALLYCTCTVASEENGDVIEAFLAKHPEWKLESIPNLPESWHTDGAAMWQIWPHIHGIDGFFMARLCKQTD
ncbi:MAG: 16S rRNA (cytosine(967)-C(5))-methyltransferase RsmB [Clostridia bacterium]|nr:16S rRNA (cytosine(967)-C(5))-methyltransferase RsmB [Clostridia bacterium]MDD4571444.1 16S rRNA (cytosine(967)-C(5))-methyltransferase RsmB [Clostridia bacterium]